MFWEEIKLSKGTSRKGEHEWINHENFARKTNIDLLSSMFFRTRLRRIRRMLTGHYPETHSKNAIEHITPPSPSYPKLPPVLNSF